MKVVAIIKPEIESVAVAVMATDVFVRIVSEELIMIELLLKLSQTESGDAAQVIFVAIPAGFVTIVGSARVRGVPN